MSAPRLNTCTECGRARPDASGQPIRCGDCLAANDPPTFGIAAAGAAFCRLLEAAALTPDLRRSFLDCVSLDADAMAHPTIWRARPGQALTPDHAAKLQHALYNHSGGALNPHPRRAAIVAAADLLERYFAAPKLSPRKREPETYCYRCGEPVPGGLFIGNSRKGARGFSWVNADGPHACTALAEPVPARIPDPTPARYGEPDAHGDQLALFAAAPAIACPRCGARRAFSDSTDDARADRRAYTCDNCRASWSVDGAQLDLFGDLVASEQPAQVALFMED